MNDERNKPSLSQPCLMGYDVLPTTSAARSQAEAQIAAKYSYLASWSNACNWKRATWLFTVSLAWAEIHRSNLSRVVYDVRNGWDEEMWQGWR